MLCQKYSYHDRMLLFYLLPVLHWICLPKSNQIQFMMIYSTIMATFFAFLQNTKRTCNIVFWSGHQPSSNGVGFLFSSETREPFVGWKHLVLFGLCFLRLRVVRSPECDEIATQCELVILYSGHDTNYL